MYSRSTWKVLPTLALRAVVHLGCTSLFAKIFARFVIKECSIEGRWEAVKRSTHEDKRIPAFLALNAEAFRGDLEELARSGKLRILRINLSALHRLTYISLEKYIQDGKAPSPERYYHASSGSDEEFFVDKEKAVEFLKEIFSSLCSLIDLDGVLMHNVRHTIPLIWAEAAKRQGLIYAVIYREGLSVSPSVLEIPSLRHRRFGRFRGDLIFVKNEQARQSFVATSFARPESVIATGDPRFDGFLGRLKGLRGAKRKKQVVLFSWAINAVRGIVFREMTTSILVEYAKLAQSHEDVQFIVKAKPEHLPNYKTGSRQLDLQSLFNDVFPDWRARNLKMSTDANVETLVSESAVVVGVQSTALLEAAITGAYVLVPVFDQLRKSAEYEQYYFHSVLDLFDLASDLQEFRDKLLRGLAGVEISQKLMTERERVFSEHIADINGGAAERITNVLLTEVGRRRPEPQYSLN